MFNTYKELIYRMASDAIDAIDYENVENGSGRAEELILEAIDNDLIYYSDQALVISTMVERGVIKWGETIDWCEIFEEVRNDVIVEIENLQERA